MGENPSMAMITSFNEWHEGTPLEPGQTPNGESYGTTYLEITDAELQS
jgi:hypothetical protein